MKKINWIRIAFFLLTVFMTLESCGLFKPKCNCPHF